MADTSLADALTLFTRVNVSMLKRIEQLEKKKSNKYADDTDKSKPESVVEESQPTEIEGFSRKALVDLQKVFQVKAKDEDKDKKKRRFEDFDDDWFFKLLKGAAFAGLIGKLWEWIKSKPEEWANALLKGLIAGLEKMLPDFFNGSIFPRMLTFFEQKLLTPLTKSLSGLFETLEKQLLTPLTKTLNRMFTSLEETLARVFPKSVTPAVGIGAERAVAQAGSKVAPTALEAAEKAVEKGVVGYRQSVQPSLSQYWRPGEYAKLKGSTPNIPKYEPGTIFDQFGRIPLKDAKPLPTQIARTPRFSAAGTVGKVLTKISKLPVIDYYFAKKEVEGYLQMYLEKKIDEKTLNELVSQVAMGSTYSYAMGMGGAAIGGAGGFGFMGVGAVPGAMLGGVAGSVAGSFAGTEDMVRLKRDYPEAAKIIEQIARDMLVHPEDFEDIKAKREGTERKQRTKYNFSPTYGVGIQDGIITKDGKIITPHADDSLYAMKSDGPFEKYFDKNVKMLEKNNEILENLSNSNREQLDNHSDLLKTTNKLLTDMMSKLQQTTVNRTSVINNNFNDGMSLRGLQAVV